MPYQPGIPTGNLNLNEDYKNIQDNFSQLDTSFGVDHVKFSITPRNGYHKALHIIPQAAPATVAGIGELYCTTVNDGIANDQTFYFKTGGGLALQMTRNVLPKALANGYTFLPGGLLLQWGTILATSGGATDLLTFSTNNIKFPSNCFSIYANPFYTGVAPDKNDGHATIGFKNLTDTSCTWYFITNSNKWAGFYWTAIGN